ncbi:MAG TPA: AsmA family protein [Candidatus Acidoferrum sp.]
MNKVRKWWKPVLALLLALAALQAGAALLVRTARARAFITRQLEISFGRTVEVREYSASLFPSPQLDAYGVSVAEDPAFGHEYFLRTDKLSAGLRWTGLLRARLELGTLQLERPSVIFVRGPEGQWNLERWLPSAAPVQLGTAAGNTGVHVTPAYRLQKIEISDGRVNFKLGDDKTSFAFLQVEGTVEQNAAGRWQLDLRAQPWRSGVLLQLAGTVRARGEVAGTSVRLQPARLQLNWEKSSLADVFRLVGGRDFGVRGLFAAEATAESGGATVPNSRAAAPGDWIFSIQTRASGIHRWDLTERADNPQVGVRMNGRWNPGAGTAQADELIIESRRSNLRGTASILTAAPSSLEVRVDSAGLQAADFLDWYRAFRPDVAEEIRAEQYFTGAASFNGWPLQLNDAAFSSSGGRWKVPGFSAPLEVRAFRGGAQNGKLQVDSVAVNIPAIAISSGPNSQSTANDAAAARIIPASASLSLAHDFAAKAGGIHIEGQSPRVQDIFMVADAFGRRFRNGWELKGKASGDLHYEWSAGKVPAWTGRADLSQVTVQVAGLNLPVQVDSLRAEWRNVGRKFTLGKVAAFGASWTGSVEQPKIVPSDFGETEIAPWNFQLQADHLDASDLDRWIGPRARPSWLRRLLPTGLGGASAPQPPSVVLQRIRATGDLRVDELTVEKIKLKQFRAQTKLAELKLDLRNVQAQWSGGDIQGTVEAAFSPEPRYEISATFERVSIVQMPWLASLSDRLAGTANGNLELHANGIGRDELLASLAGKGELRLANVELQGWDIPGTMALGEWKTGTSRWTAGAGTFHLGDGGFDLNALRLASPSGEFLLKGSVSFSEDTDLTAESYAAGHKTRLENTVRFMQISGPLAEPKVSLERATAQRPGD